MYIGFASAPAMAVRAPLLTAGKQAMDSCSRTREGVMQQNNSMEHHGISQADLHTLNSFYAMSKSMGA